MLPFLHSFGPRCRSPGHGREALVNTGDLCECRWREDVEARRLDGRLGDEGKGKESRSPLAVATKGEDLRRLEFPVRLS